MEIQSNMLTSASNISSSSTPIPIWTTMADDLASLNTELSYMKVSGYPITPIYYTTVAKLVAKVESDYQTALTQMDPATLNADFAPIQNQVLDAGISPSGPTFEEACNEASAPGGNPQDLINFLTELQSEPQGIIATILMVLNNGSQAFRNYHPPKS